MLLPPRASFFTRIRPLFKNHLSPGQVQGLNALLDAGAVLPNQQSLSYLLATALHETAHTMQPVREYGRGAGHDYGKKLDMGTGPGHRVPYTTPDVLYYGRGYCQLTWRCNYRTFSHLLGLDLVAAPDLALRPDVAAAIIVQGMSRGLFTGKKLADYFGGNRADPVNARKIINGLDRATTIASYYNAFQVALKE